VIGDEPIRSSAAKCFAARSGSFSLVSAIQPA